MRVKRSVNNPAASSAGARARKGRKNKERRFENPVGRGPKKPGRKGRPGGKIRPGKPGNVPGSPQTGRPGGLGERRDTTFNFRNAFAG